MAMRGFVASHHMKVHNHTTPPRHLNNSITMQDDHHKLRKTHHYLNATYPIQTLPGPMYEHESSERKFSSLVHRPQPKDKICCYDIPQPSVSTPLSGRHEIVDEHHKANDFDKYRSIAKDYSRRFAANQCTLPCCTGNHTSSLKRKDHFNTDSLERKVFFRSPSVCSSRSSRMNSIESDYSSDAVSVHSLDENDPSSMEIKYSMSNQVVPRDFDALREHYQTKEHAQDIVHYGRNINVEQVRGGWGKTVQTFSSGDSERCCKSYEEMIESDNHIQNRLIEPRENQIRTETTNEDIGILRGTVPSSPQHESHMLKNEGPFVREKQEERGCTTMQCNSPTYFGVQLHKEVETVRRCNGATPHSTHKIFNHLNKLNNCKSDEEHNMLSAVRDFNPNTRVPTWDMKHVQSKCWHRCPCKTKYLSDQLAMQYPPSPSTIKHVNKTVKEIRSEDKNHLSPYMERLLPPISPPMLQRIGSHTYPYHYHIPYCQGNKYPQKQRLPRGQSNEQKASAEGEKKNPKGTKCLHLWQFLQKTLEEEEGKEDRCIEWTDRKLGEFRLINTALLAHKWGQSKNSTCMTYEKMARAMRYYYNTNILEKVPHKRLHFRFSEKIAAKLCKDTADKNGVKKSEDNSTKKECCLGDDDTFEEHVDIESDFSESLERDIECLPTPQYNDSDNSTKDLMKFEEDQSSSEVERGEKEAINITEKEVDIVDDGGTYTSFDSGVSSTSEMWSDTDSVDDLIIDTDIEDQVVA